MRSPMPGRFWEEFRAGEVIEHGPGRTITQADNVLFCGLTMNNQPLHLDPEWAKRESPYGRIVVNGILTFGLAVGMSVKDLTEKTLVANLGYSEIAHPAPVYPGDTITASSKVVDKRLTSKAGRGIVTVKTTARKQDDTEVCTFTRTIMVKTKDPRLVGEAKARA